MESSVAPRPESSDAARVAFERYVTPEIGALLRAARTLERDAHEAEDLVQETLVNAFRAIERFDGAHPRAWLLTIMRHAHYNRARRRRSATADDPEASEAVAMPPSRDPGVRVERVAFREAVLAALATLSDTQRSVVELVDLEGYSYAEVATALDVPVGTVMSRLHRGRRAIRHRLDEVGLLTPEER